MMKPARINVFLITTLLSLSSLAQAGYYIDHARAEPAELNAPCTSRHHTKQYSSKVHYHHVKHHRSEPMDMDMRTGDDDPAIYRELQIND